MKSISSLSELQSLYGTKQPAELAYKLTVKSFKSPPKTQLKPASKLN